MKKRFLILAGLTLTIFCLDLWTKNLAVTYLTHSVELLPFLGFELTKNSALAFGIPLPQLAIIILSLIAIGLILWLFLKQTKKEVCLGTLAFGLILGGAAGNLWERVMNSSVTDFVVFLGIPNFNLADSAITVGVVILLIFQKRIFSSSFFD